MNDDVLARAARALRDAHDGASLRAASIGDRVLVAARRRARKRRSAVVFVAALAAVFVLATAWAAMTTRALPDIGAWVRGSRPAPRPHPRTEVPSEPPTAPVAVPPPSADVPDEAPARSAASLPVSVLSRKLRSPPPRPSTSSPQPPPDNADPEGDLYGAAHRTHFVTRDPARALRAWDAYLDAYPNGRFALEARYNRALALVRLGRGVEARAALTPFANGEVGGYRQKEARELLEAMGP